MKTIKYFSVFAIVFSAIFAANVAVISAQSRNEILIVADQKASCRGVVAMDCLQVKHLNEERFGLFYQNIERFKFVAGYFYVLDVAVSDVRNPPADASKNRYRLNKVLAQTRLSAGAGTQPAFYGTEWKLVAINNSKVDLDKPFIRFDEAKKSIGGNGGCNVFGGSMEKNGTELKFSKIFSTKMFCDGAQDVENKFLGALDGVTNYEIKNGKLYLISNNKVLLEFEPKK